ncbi:hypothetical protein Poly24_55270 [Rosistilla carotiformis]|uniref:VWFA domain-containing protein n=1 Tax=Rosistilla carotiformis TaxID=2528017 RepID=A0A518K1Y9_9BACT|nr:vWA domain-containing protein [Rosistilla carotiformis]QDV71787.1 hypothetical protein Poly24_55270 [Rosistilla carotiformis]
MIFAADTRWEFQHAWPLPAWAMVLLFVAVAGWMTWLLIRQRLAWQRVLGLSVLRLSAVALLFGMLGGWRLSFFETELPDLILLVDDSASMQLPSGDSAGEAGIDRLTRARDLLAEPGRLETLGERYRLKLLAISDQMRPVDALQDLQAQGLSSRLGDGLLQIANAQRGRSTAAIVLLSDGVVTEGVALRVAADQLASQNIPLWTVGIGGEQSPPELAIDEVIADDHAFLGDEVQVRVLLRGSAPPGSEVAVELRDRDSEAVLDRRQVRMEAASTRTVVPLRFSANRPGPWNLEVVAPPIAGEIFTDNNRKPMRVVVRDEPIGVLLIAQQPSYEFRFLKHLLERAQGQGAAAENLIRLTSVLQDGDPRYAEQDRSAATLPPVKASDLQALDVVILCDADIDQLGDLMIDQIDNLVRSQGTGLVVVAGPENRLAARGSAWDHLMPVKLEDLKAPTGLQSRPLTVFRTRLGEASGELPLPAGIRWSDLPPFYWLLRAPAVKPAAQVVLATDETGKEVAPTPVIVTQIVGAGQVWLQLSDESFRWLSGSSIHNLHERYWLQVIRQLARRKRIDTIDRAVLQVSGTRFTQGQSVEIELALPAAEPRRQARVAIRSPDDPPRLETLYPSSDPQRLRGTVSDLPAGDYWIELIDPVFESPPEPVALRIETPSIEIADGRAALLALDEASQISGGKMLSVAQATGSLWSSLPVGRAIRLRELPSRPIWNHWIVAAIVVGLLSGEWILRRRWGLA